MPSGSFVCHPNWMVSATGSTKPGARNARKHSSMSANRNIGGRGGSGSEGAIGFENWIDRLLGDLAEDIAISAGFGQPTLMYKVPKRFLTQGSLRVF